MLRWQKELGCCARPQPDGQLPHIKLRRDLWAYAALPHQWLDDRVGRLGTAAACDRFVVFGLARRRAVGAWLASKERWLLFPRARWTRADLGLAYMFEEAATSFDFTLHILAGDRV